MSASEIPDRPLISNVSDNIHAPGNRLTTRVNCCSITMVTNSPSKLETGAALLAFLKQCRASFINILVLTVSLQFLIPRNLAILHFVFCFWIPDSGTMAHAVHTACHGTLSVCFIFSENVGSPLVLESQICISDLQKHTLSNLATKAIPDTITGDQTWDAAVESNCSLESANQTARYILTLPTFCLNLAFQQNIYI